MQAWKRRLEAVGEVFTFDCPYVQAGRRSPDRPPVLLVDADRRPYFGTAKSLDTSFAWLS